ncbi:hypothetical protein MPTK1_6g10610 [Marchantia polymorpha subsp. ruderalis]|uniref:Uncharacterized protein n=2 Tax=Marchantia polymorpha TaxID=3197 RepID=A0AAF6BQM8_MARPO|nr:hypothetical protein MARPO_0016s0102 [Marchantia polymorpha]BBN14312.1 hypothetical protein Mp_6g10610 [Marchantia polymorpha subsp. ruderalis]|eukprot:PTQ45046.1 hypothetical protein MARPO_0016s0102 [Marchantia polymorpha]
MEQTSRVQGNLPRPGCQRSVLTLDLAHGKSSGQRESQNVYRETKSEVKKRFMGPKRLLIVQVDLPDLYLPSLDPDSM